MKIRRAVISVSDKTGIVEFAKGLQKLGVDILSTGGTAKTLRENGIEVTDISAYTGSPEILDGRLKTLHPMIHGGILGMRDNSKHQKEMVENKIEPIDMVVVNLYPFEATIEKEECTLEEAIENIDIGGPTMLRAAAKNWHDVAVIVDANDYEKILDEMKSADGNLSSETAFGLAKKVFASTARYDSAICNYLNVIDSHFIGNDQSKNSPPMWGNNQSKNSPPPLGGRTKVGGEGFPAYLGLTYEKAEDLRYGENPHQKAAFYKEHKITEPCIAGAEQLHGKELSYNNIMDADAAIELVKEFSGETFVAILKHTNPCGAALSTDSLLDAFKKARAVDPVSAFGGVIGLSLEVDEDTATAMAETFFEVIVAPSFSSKALKILQKKKNIRLLQLPGLSLRLPAGNLAGAERGNPVGFPWQTRKVVGGLLVQDRDLGVVDVHDCAVKTKRKPTDEEYSALEFAWKICKHVKSNAIVYATNGQLLGVGAGQMSRVDSAKIAAQKMEETVLAGNIQKPELIVCASDAFFPFRDGIDAAFEAGATAVIQPGGSIKDEETIQAADEHNMTMLFTGMRHFKH